MVQTGDMPRNDFWRLQVAWEDVKASLLPKDLYHQETHQAKRYLRVSFLISNEGGKRGIVDFSVGRKEGGETPFEDTFSKNVGHTEYYFFVKGCDTFLRSSKLS